MKPEFIGLTIAAALVGYKVCIYASAKYQLDKAKKQKIADFDKVSKYKQKVIKEEEQ
jgi:hypothetical protein